MTHHFRFSLTRLCQLSWFPLVLLVLLGVIYPYSS